MDDKDKEAFEKWWDEIRLRGQSTFGIVAITWQAACEYKQKEIDELEESLVVRLSKSYIAGKDLSKIIQKNLTNEIEKLKDENAKLKECVEFYANEINWPHPSRVGLSNVAQDRSDEYSVPGERARQALKELDLN